MKNQVILAICLVLLIGMVSAVPSIPHAFRGDAKYTNGQNIPNGYIVTARLDNQPISTNSIIKDGKYGYDDPLLVSDIIGNGKKVYFYINGELVENDPIDFVIGEVTSLNLIVKSPPSPSNFDGCGDGYCDIYENECSYCLVDCNIDDCIGDGKCDATIGENCLTAPQDCGDCSSTTTYSSSSGGGGGSPPQDTPTFIPATTSTQTPNGTNGEQDEILDIDSLNEEQTRPGITGAVIGFAKSKPGMGLIFVVLVLIAGIAVMVLKKKSTSQPTPEASSEEKVEEVETQ